MTATIGKPDEAMLKDARSGDPSAIRALAAWYWKPGRDPIGRGMTAYQLEVYALELEERHRQAAKLRRLLAELHFTQVTRESAPTRRELEYKASEYGLPLQVYTYRPCINPEGNPDICYGTWDDADDATGFMIIAPTDGAMDGRVRTQLKMFFNAAFPGEYPLTVRFENEPMSDAGEGAMYTLGLKGFGLKK